MESKELRIGNWVLSPENKYEQIRAIWQRDDAEYWASDYDRKLFPLETRIGIPLTPELLIKIGFEMYDEANTRFIFEGYYYYDDCIWFDTTQIEVLYLHDWQNLYFALNGEELEINLK